MEWCVHLCMVLAVFYPIVVRGQLSITVLQATESAQVFITPNYPNNYPAKVDLYWRVSTSNLDTTLGNWVVNIEIEDLRIESDPGCAFDYLVIYDGSSNTSSKLSTMCGVYTAFPFSSSGSQMYFHFHSDESVTFKGFKIKYWATYTAFAIVTKHPSVLNHTPYYIVGGVLGGAALFIIVGISIYCIYRQTYKAKARPASICRKTLAQNPDGSYAYTYKSSFDTYKSPENGKSELARFYGDEPVASTSTQLPPLRRTSGIEAYRNRIAPSVGTYSQPSYPLCYGSTPY